MRTLQADYDWWSRLTRGRSSLAWSEFAIKIQMERMLINVDSLVIKTLALSFPRMEVRKLELPGAKIGEKVKAAPGIVSG